LAQSIRDGQAPAMTVDIPAPERGAGEASRSNVPYYDVYTAYRRSAEAATNNEAVPPADRQRVKDYFTALDPYRE
jgi:hypothetical protein